LIRKKLNPNKEKGCHGSRETYGSLSLLDTVMYAKVIGIGPCHADKQSIDNIKNDK